MAQVILKLYKSSPTPWNKETRQSLIDVSDGLISLSWGYRPSTGGLWGGKAKFVLTEDTPAYEDLVAGSSGTYEIQWIPTLEADRLIANYDAFKTNFLLNFGTYENVNIDFQSHVCSMDLKGAAQHFHKVLVKLNPTEEQKPLHELVTAAYEQSIIDDSVIRDIDVSTLGSAQREYMIKEQEAEMGTFMENMQTRAGGANLWGWGVRPTSSLTAGIEELGEAYFQPYTGPDELADDDKKAAWFMPRSSIITSKLRRRDSDIKNIIYVRSDKSSQEEDEYPFQGQARNEYSIARYGARELVVYDSSIEDEQAANDLAAIICESKSNPQDEIELLASVPLDEGDQGGSPDGKFSGLIQTGLRDGTNVIYVEGEDNPAEQGQSQGCNFTGGGSGDAASCLKIDTSIQPGGPRAAYPNLKTAGNLASGQEITYVIQGKQTSGSKPTDDIAVMELDRQISIGWQYVSGTGKFKMEAKYFNASSAWASGAVSTAQVLWSALSAEHTIYLTLIYGTTGVVTLKVNVATDSATVELISVSFAAASLLGTGSNDLILANAWEGSGSGGVADPDQSRSFDLSGFSAYVSDTDGDYGNVDMAGLIAGTKNQTPPSTYAAYRVLNVLLGIKSAGDTKCLVRYRPASSRANLIVDGSFEALPILHSNMFGGQTQSILDLDQESRGLNGHTNRTYTYPNGYQYLNTLISPQRSRFEADRAYCVTYDVLSYDSGKIEIGVVDGTDTDDAVELSNEVKNNHRQEFELDLTGSDPDLYYPLVGNITKHRTCKWSITNLQMRSIGGGSLVVSSGILECATWEHWSVIGDASDGETQRAQTQIGWKDGSDGKTSARIAVGTTGSKVAFFYQTGIVDNWRRYQVTFMAKSPDASAVVGVLGGASIGSTTNLVTVTPALTSNWASYTIDFWGNGNTSATTSPSNIPATSGWFAIGSFSAGNSGKTLHIDQVVVREIPSPGEPKSGYFATLQKQSGNASDFGLNTLGANFGNSLIGSGEKGRRVGGAIEVIPRDVQVTYQSGNSPLLVKIKGSVQTDAVSSDIESLKERIAALDNSLRGSN